MIEGVGRFQVGDEYTAGGGTVWAPAGVVHGVANDGTPV